LKKTLSLAREIMQTTAASDRNFIIRRSHQRNAHAVIELLRKGLT